MSHTEKIESVDCSSVDSGRDKSIWTLYGPTDRSGPPE